MIIEDYIATLPLTESSVAINDIFLEEKIPGLRITSVSGRESMESEISETSIQTRDGTIFNSKRTLPRTLTVTCNISVSTRDLYNSAVRELYKLLRDDNLHISFADLNDRYYVGNIKTFDPGSVMKMSTPKCYVGVCTMSFYCADPYAYSKTEKKATNEGSNVITLQNDGDSETVVSVKATMKSDNGYIGFTLGDRFYQIGKPEEVDGETYEQTERLFDDHLYEDKGWLVNQGVTPPVTPTRLENGTIRYVREYDDEGYATVASYASGTSWHGASLTKQVPADKNGAYAKNWRSDYRYDFNTDGSANKGIEVGHNSVTYSDADGNIICSIVFEDNNPVTEQSDMYIYVEENRVLAMKNMGKQFYDTQRSGRCVSIEKIENQLTVRFSAKGINKTFLLQHPERELRKVTWYGAAYKTYTNIRNNLIRALNVYKHNVENFNNIPNYFANGDIVEVNGETGDVLINSVYNMDVTDIGSQPLVLQPGQHSLGIVKSSFATIPDVEVTYRERWL